LSSPLHEAGAGRLLDYAWLEGTDPGGQDYADYRAFLPAAGFREFSRTRRGWTRIPQQAGAARVIPLPVLTLLAAEVGCVGGIYGIEAARSWLRS
jgi:hypothetical protein